MSNILIGLKKTCLGVLERGDRGKGNETGLKEGGEIEMSINYSASITRCSLLRFEYLPVSFHSSHSPTLPAGAVPVMCCE